MLTSRCAILRSGRECGSGAFLVDTGAIDSPAPRRRLEAIGLKPTGRRRYATADGREVEMVVTISELEIMGELSGGIIVFGDESAEPLLGSRRG